MGTLGVLLGIFGYSLALLDTLGTFGYFRYFWLLLGILGSFGYFWLLLGIFGYFKTLFGSFGMFWHFFCTFFGTFLLQGTLGWKGLELEWPELAGNGWTLLIIAELVLFLFFYFRF